MGGQLDRTILGYVTDDYDLTEFKVAENQFYSWVDDNKADLEACNKTILDYISVYGGLIMYHVIEKITSNAGVISRNYTGYVNTGSLLDITLTAQSNYYDWLTTNKTALQNGTKTVSEYIEAQPNDTIYINPFDTSTVDGMNLNLWMGV